MHALVKTAAVAALGVVAWKAWQRRRTPQVEEGRDSGGFTPKHGDPRVPAVEDDFSVSVRAPAQSSPGFGAA